MFLLHPHILWSKQILLIAKITLWFLNRQLFTLNPLLMLIFQACCMTSWHLMYCLETGLFIKAISHERLCVKPCLCFRLAPAILRNDRWQWREYIGCNSSDEVTCWILRLPILFVYYVVFVTYIICLSLLKISQLQKKDKTTETRLEWLWLFHILVFIFYRPSQDY